MNVMCGSSTLNVVALLLLLVTSVQGEEEDLCAGKDKEFVCIDTVHYKVCLPPELKRVEGDEPVVRCPDATQCDERSPWRCSAANMASPSTASPESVAHVARRGGGGSGAEELLLCPAQGAFRGDDDCRSYLWCRAKGAEGALRRCDGDASAFDVVLGKCVSAASLTVDPRNAACLPPVSPAPQLVQLEQDQPEQQLVQDRQQQQLLVEQDQQQLVQERPQQLEQGQAHQLEHNEEQELEQDKPEEVAQDQAQQLRSKRGVGSVLNESACGSGAACSTMTSDPSHLLDLLFEESEAAPEQRDKRDAVEARGKEAPGILLNAPPSRKNRPESGDVKKQKLERRAEHAEEHKVVKDKEGQHKASKEPKAPEEKRLQAKVVEEKSVEAKEVEENLPELNVDWMDRVRTLLKQVEEDKERWKKMRNDRPMQSSYRRWSRVHSDYKGRTSDMFEGDTLRARRPWTKREGDKGKLGSEEEKETDEGNHTFLFQERAQKTDEEGKKADEKRARGGGGGGWRKVEGEIRKSHHHKHRHHQQKHKEQRSGKDRGSKMAEVDDGQRRLAGEESDDALEEDEEDKGEGGVDVFKDKDHRGELVHFAPRDKDKKVEKGNGRKDTRAVYVVKVSSGVTEAPKLMEAAAKMQKEEESTPPAGSGAGTVCYYTCMPSHGGGNEAEKTHPTQTMEETATGASSEEPSRGSTEAGEATQGQRTSVKTLDFSGRVKVSEKCDDEEKPGAEQSMASTPDNRSKQLLDINFDQLMEDNARVYHGGCLQAAPPHRERKAEDGGGGKLYALPEQYKADEVRELDQDGARSSLELTTNAHVDLKKKAVSMGKAKAPPEGLAVDVQQQLRGGAVQMPGVEAARSEDEDADEEEDEGGAVSMTERDVFRGRRRGTQKAESGGDENHVDVNVTLELSNETFQPPVFNCHGRGGRFPDPSSVHRYYSCAPSLDGASFQATRLICPAGREFDPALGDCVRRHQGGDDVLPPASAARPPPPPPCPADRVLDRSTGMCVRADATTPQCPPGTVYDRNTGECRRESSLDLVSRLLPPWPHVSLTSPLQRCVRPGRLANPRDCSSFFLCVPRRRRDADAPDGGFMRLLVACPSQSVFDPGSGRCAPGSPRTCQLRLRRCRRPGRFARSDAPADYVLCTPDLTPLHMRCPPGQTFSRSLRHCVVLTPPPLSS